MTIFTDIAQLRHTLIAATLTLTLAMHPTASQAASVNLSGVLSDLSETQLSFPELYAENRQLDIGDFITFDLAAHAFSRLWHSSIQAYEDDIIQPHLTTVIEQLQAALAEQADDPVTQANRDIAQLLAALLSDNTEDLSALARQEHALIIAASGQQLSPLMGYNIDYSQFQARGTYAESEQRSRFFRAYRYAASVFFPFRPSAALGVGPDQGQKLTQQLVQLAQIAQAKPALGHAIRTLHDAILHFFPGRYASLSLAQIATIPPEQLLQHARQTNTQPEVLYGLIDASQLEAGLSVHDALTGFRLAPALETISSRTFQRLVYNSTGVWQGGKPEPLGLGQIPGFGPAKVRPLMDEFIASLGMPVLTDQLRANGEQNFAGYEQAWLAIQHTIDQLSGQEAARVKLWQRYLDSTQDAFWPQRSETIKAWWTELAHAELLYQAQSYTVTGKGIRLEANDAAARGATIEARPDAFLGLLALSADLAAQAPALRMRWSAYTALVLQAAELAQKIADGDHLNLDDEAFLRALPEQFEQLTETPSQALIVDIHSGIDGPQAEVVYAATGYVREQVVERDNLLFRGARYRFFSFSQPAAERLTDEAWRMQLKQLYAERAISTWRQKLAPELRRDWILARATQDQTPRALVIHSSAVTQTAAWLTQHDPNHSVVETDLLLSHLTPALIETLARQPEVHYIEPQVEMEAFDNTLPPDAKP